LFIVTRGPDAVVKTRLPAHECRPRLTLLTMTTLAQRAVLALLATTAVAVPAVALADTAPDGTVKASPNKQGAGSTLVLDTKGQTQPAGTSGPPSKVVLAFTRGFAFDARALSARCSDDQASKNDCPKDSKTGSGFADFHTNINVSGRATIGEFLATRKSGASGDVQFVVHVPQTGDSAARGHLVRIGGKGRFGYELRLNFPAMKNVPASVVVTIDRLYLRTGAKRTVTVRVGPHHRKVHRTYTLVRNPKKCPSTHRWPTQLRAQYDTGDKTTDANIVCRTH
jgi:hypothetical protein